MRKLKISGARVVMLVGLLAPMSSANAGAGRIAQKTSVVLLQVEGTLLKFQEEQTDRTYRPGAPIHGLFEFPPEALFVITTPEIYRGRTFHVVFKCNLRKGMLGILESGVDHVFRLALPRDFLNSSDSSIEDCTIGRKGMARWQLQDKDERVQKASSLRALHKAVEADGRSPAAPARR